MKREKTVKVLSILGLHTRPATQIVKLLQRSKSCVMLAYDGECVNARSILNILTLAVPYNASITLKVEGEDADETLDRLVGVFEQNFPE